MCAVVASVAGSQETTDNDAKFVSSTFDGMKFRSIGPSLTSGRISDIAVHPHHRKIYYAATASDGLWKTINSGTTWTPVFDSQASYSIGCVTIDPNNALVVWVGSGENNSQRSVAWGDGVYKSVDGGKTWNNVGLPHSEHIAKIVIDPRDSDTVFVASQGPLWQGGGERGLYKTTDGGKTWDLVLEISEDTGVTDVLMDPRNPDVLIAASYQRRRHVWTLVNGGPESALHKSTDGGQSWEKLDRGLPSGDIGRIGLAQSLSEPDVVYAIIEAAGESGGFYRSLDHGSNWAKQSGYVSGSPQYHQEIVVDPDRSERIYSLDTWMMVSEDAGKNWKRLGERFKHVDNHALWIDPEDTDYLLAGCDGGMYESFDRGATWHFKSNLPLTQFYRVSVDNDFPFYNIFGGTQDNFSLGGPSRTTSAHGIMNSDWFVTRGGDGFETVVDPEDPNILYAQSQHGGLVRFDRKSGEAVFIRPQPGSSEDGLKWNWDSPLIISPHSHTRLYFAANRLFRSDDRGNSWTAISPDLTDKIDRNELEVMGKVWSVDAVAKNTSTSMYGSIVSLTESPVQEGLLYVGTDDGLIHTSSNAGQTWSRTELPQAVPERTLVSRLEASRHDTDVIYAAFDNHKMGDFAPYAFRSRDRGASWDSIAGNLPEDGPVYAVVEDHENPDLMFAGTEFGVFFTVDAGDRWTQLKGGLPTISMRDLAIQRRESDLVLGTFGRGFYLLDNYSPLRQVGNDLLGEEATLFPVKRSWMFMEALPLGLRSKSFQGDSFYTADNPPVGAVFTYYLKDALVSRKKSRQAEEKRIEGEGGTVRYPTWDELRAEDRERAPTVWLTVEDASGQVVRRLSASTSKGFHRLAWDFRFPDSLPVTLDESAPDNPFQNAPIGPMVVPGSYEVSLSKEVDGVVTPLAEPQVFEAVALGTASLAASDSQALLSFQQETATLQAAVLGAVRAAEQAKDELTHIRKAVLQSPKADLALLEEVRVLEDRLYAMQGALSGNSTRRSRSEPTPPSIVQRVQGIVSGQWMSTSAPTGTHIESLRIAGEQFEPILEELRTFIERDVRVLENKLDELGAPWTPGRLPYWKRAR